MTWENVAPAEVALTLIPLIGLAMTLLGLHDALGDLKFLRISGQNGERKLVAWGNVRSEATRCLLLGAFMLVGVGSMLTPPRPDGAPLEMIRTGVLILASVLLALGSVLDRRDRQTLIRRALDLPTHTTAERLSAIDETVSDNNAMLHAMEPDADPKATP